MNGRMREMGVTLFGLATSVLTALILFLVDWKLGFGIYTLSVLFLIPVGAICSGAAAASGYYLGAVRFGVRPTWRLLISMVAISTACFFLIYHLTWQTMEVTQGQQVFRVADHISFSEFLDESIRNMTIGRVNDNDPGKGSLGSWGYLFAVLQVLGFAAGGIAVWFFLRAKPYCEDCLIYLTKISTTHHYVRTPEEIDSTMASLLEDGITHWDKHVEGLGHPKVQKGLDFDLKVTDLRCPTCDLRAVSLEGLARNGSDWRTTFLTHDRWHANAAELQGATAATPQEG